MSYDEPPENYMMDPPYCEDCKEEECLLDSDKKCPAQEEAERIAHAEWQAGEHRADQNQEEFSEDFEEYLTNTEHHAEMEPSEEEKDFMRRHLIDFEEEL